MAIMAALAGCESADFAFLLHVTGLTRGNLSAHTARLEEAGYVQIEKGFAGKVPHTEYSLTPAGQQAFNFYREQLKLTLTKMRGDGE